MSQLLHKATPYLFLLSIGLCFLACQNQEKSSTTTSNPDIVIIDDGATKQLPTVKFLGSTMGTYYAITYIDEQERNFQKEIDQLLADFNQSLSTYIPNSVISKLNKAPVGEEVTVDSTFIRVLNHSITVHQKTDGAFDPTVMPLVNGWGFGYDKSKKGLSEDEVKQLLKLVGLNQFILRNFGSQSVVLKKIQGAELDFSAIAKGYGVDLIADFLKQKGIENFLVDIGGELVAKGRNNRQDIWTVGIDRPEFQQKNVRKLEHAVFLNNRAIATSGNYRNYYTKDGVKYAHTINPKTGYSEQSNLLSVSIFAPTCLEADAYATACMVMGLEKAEQFVKNEANLDALFIFRNDQGEMESRMTAGVKTKR